MGSSSFPHVLDINVRTFSQLFVAGSLALFIPAGLSTTVSARSSPDLSPADRVAASGRLQLQEKQLTRTNQGIFYDCFGASINEGSPLDEAINVGARVCWQNLCNQPISAGAEAPSGSGNSRYKRRQIPASRYPSKLEKILIRPLEAGDWGDFQLCLLANLGVFDSVSVGLSAESLKALVWATEASVGNHTIMGEFVDYCLDTAANNKLQQGDSDRVVKPSAKEQANLKAMYDKFSTCMRKQIQTACYLSDNIMYTAELSDRSEYLYSLLPRPKRKSPLVQDDSNGDAEKVSNKSRRLKRETSSEPDPLRERTIIVKRWFLNRAPISFHGYPDLIASPSGSGSGFNHDDGGPFMPGGNGPHHEDPPRPVRRPSFMPVLRPSKSHTSNNPNSGEQPATHVVDIDSHFRPADDGRLPSPKPTFPLFVKPTVATNRPARRQKPAAAADEGQQGLLPTNSPDESERPFLMETPAANTVRPTQAIGLPTKGTTYYPPAEGDDGEDYGGGGYGVSVTEANAVVPEKVPGRPRPTKPTPFPRPAASTKRTTTTSTTEPPYVPPWNPRTIRVDLCSLKVDIS